MGGALKKMGRATMHVSTAGLSLAVKAGKSKCGQCGHSLSAHRGAAAPQVVVQQHATPLVQQAPVQAPVAAAPVPAPGPIDVAEQLAKLAALRDQGVLTDEEFETQKARLLEA